jgi:hypothetical protein
MHEFICAIPSWDAWARFEVAINDPGDRGALRQWQQRLYTRSRRFRRFLMFDAALSPLRAGRQPARSDRVGSWDEG